MIYSLNKAISREAGLFVDGSIKIYDYSFYIVQPQKTQINPYYLGLKVFEDIEERYNNPTEEMKKLGVKPGSGREKMFEVREIESDISFIRNYLTKDLVLREDMYLFQKQGRDYKIVDKQWKEVRDQPVGMRVNGGFPFISVTDGDYLKNGELYLTHYYEGIELDVKYLEKVMPYIHQLWGRPVHIETSVSDKQIVFVYDGKKIHRRYL